MVTFGQRVRLLRKQKRMSQTDLAKKCGCCQGAITAIERGLREPNLQTIRKIQLALGITLAKMFKGVE